MSTTQTEELARRWSAVMMGNYKTPPIALARGVGATVWDVDGREYTDLLGGIATTILGHAHPKVTEAISTQAATLGHVSNLAMHEPGVLLAERLLELAGRPGRVFFCNSGAEANEAAFKLSRLTGRTEVVTVSWWVSRESIVGFAGVGLDGAQGARLAVSGSNAGKLESFRDTLGGDHVALGCDLSDAAAVDGLVPRAVEALGGKIEHVIRTRMFVTDVSKWEEVAKEHGAMFADIRPATSIVEVAKLIDAAAMIEIEADAVIS